MAGGQSRPVMLHQRVAQVVPRRRQFEPDGQYRVVVGAVAGAMLSRRLVSTLVPHDYATGHALNTYLHTLDSSIPLASECAPR